MTFVEYVGVLPAGPLRGPGAALPRRRLPGAAPDRAGRGARPRSSTDLIEWLGELVRQVDSQPARRVGAARAPGEDGGRGRSAAARRRARRRHRATPARSGCWCATRCSAGWSWPRCAGGTCWASSTARPAGTRTRWARGARAVLRRARRHRHRPRRPRARRCSRSPRSRERWLVRQVLDDPAGDHDWAISAEVDLAASDEEGAAVVWVTAVEPAPEGRVAARTRDRQPVSEVATRRPGHGTRLVRAACRRRFGDDDRERQCITDT